MAVELRRTRSIWARNAVLVVWSEARVTPVLSTNFLFLSRCGRADAVNEPSSFRASLKQVILPCAS